VRQIVYVCQGKKCSRACAHDALLRTLYKVSDVRLVGCQKICKGSVIGTVLDDRVEWFEQIDSPRLCVRARNMVRNSRRKKLDKGIKRRRVKAMSGRGPR
jgi:hypothetical protein